MHPATTGDRHVGHHIKSRKRVAHITPTRRAWRMMTPLPRRTHRLSSCVADDDAPIIHNLASLSSLTHLKNLQTVPRRLRTPVVYQTQQSITVPRRVCFLLLGTNSPNVAITARRLHPSYPTIDNCAKETMDLRDGDIYDTRRQGVVGQAPFDEWRVKFTLVRVGPCDSAGGIVGIPPPSISKKTNEKKIAFQNSKNDRSSLLSVR
ncbi:hypothetical protein BDN70DRAFT_894876 [Pholiota conissans]|uniref:Uncharacterized protein n=1 Tax=Pholiota conissans TaxID=109636 RepID=A0A9P6D0P7_9AGAR|nr:hypothetical protein BDN70DRAFT_894876 [Pholiota conissans]